MKVLHLVGSQTSEYYSNLSRLYAPGCLKSFPDLEHVILLAHLDGSWSLLLDADEHSLEADILDSVPKLSLAKALSILEEKNSKPDILQPHMFCYRGMTTFRSIADMLDIPILGSAGSVMALTTNKWQTRAVVASVGVPVPQAAMIKKEETPSQVLARISLPFLLKPAREDNSMGISLVREEKELVEALATAFEFDDLVFAEQFIPLGREIRVGVVETENGKELEMLPAMEYVLHQKKVPIRTSLDKLTPTDAKEGLAFTPVDRICPAPVSDKLRSKLKDLATKAHHALDCQHYSLYDVRVDPDENPYFIEASPYCSFSPKSAIVCMGAPLYDDRALFLRLAKKAIDDFEATTGTNAATSQSLGMRKHRRNHSPNSVLANESTA